ncbi:hypothetical protein [Gordonia sp. (in: high G+C Gram-positive bacteria)]|uniref:hypothetical protein n=1 Tax=Gordonia sp. (in: high G+C Gram-positive bacteria) TaxID=84139 RepID=UPI003C73A7E4
MSVDRKPAISSRRHPGEDLPERPSGAPATQSAAPGPASVQAREPQPTATPVEEPSEKFSDQLNTKMRPSTRTALYEAVSVQQFITGTRSSIQGIIDAAVLEYIDNHNLRRPS